MSLYLGENLISGVATPVEPTRNIGQIIPSTIPLTDAGLHLLDGSLIQGNGIYSAFVTYIAGLVSTYPDLFETEANWQTAVTNYGVCGKFVYDSTNNTVRLPKITGIVEGTTDLTALGDLVEAGLPNITGSFEFDVWSDSSTGAFIDDGGDKRSGTDNDGNSKGSKKRLDASRSSSIYGNSSTVQPQSIKVLYYIVIATSVKTNIEVDIDEIATDLNSKADKDFSNITSTGTSLASGWSMPSDRYIDLTLGADNTTYTAPGNGWLVLNKGSSATGQRVILIASVSNGVYSSAASQSLVACIPMKKGSSAIIRYTADGTTNMFRFIYAEGEN